MASKQKPAAAAEESTPSLTSGAPPAAGQPGPAPAAAGPKPKRKRSKARGETTQERLIARQRQDTALQLRINGVKLEDIAKQLGYKGHTGAMAAIKAALDRIPDPDVRTMRKIFGERYEEAIFAAHKDAMNVASPNHEKAAKLWLTAMDKLVKLYGAEVQPDPKKQTIAVELTGDGNKPLDVVVTELTVEERSRIWDENAALLKRMSMGQGPPPEGEIDRTAEFAPAESELERRPKGWAEGGEDDELPSP